jgi:aryl carrier-like protein
MEPTAESTNDDQLAERLASATPDERHDLLRELVLRRAAAILDAPAMDEESNFLQNGLNSLNALELAKSLMNDTGLEVPIIAVVEHPTPTLLGKFLAETYEADAS